MCALLWIGEILPWHSNVNGHKVKKSRGGEMWSVIKLEGSNGNGCEVQGVECGVLLNGGGRMDVVCCVKTRKRTGFSDRLKWVS